MDLKKYNIEHFKDMKSSSTLLRYFEMISGYLNGRVLDIGCAKGPMQNFVKGEYYGVDINKKFGKYVKNFKCVDASREKLPFKSDFFDVVLIFSVLEHVENFIFMLEEARRALKKNGKIIIIVPNQRHIMYSGIIFKRFELQQKRQSPHIHSFTEEDLRNLFFITKFKPTYIDRANNMAFGKDLPEWRILKFFSKGLIAIAAKR